MKNIIRITTSVLAAAAAVMLSSCDSIDYPDRYQVSDGVPTVYSIRYADQDLNITQAYMDEVICILGENLRSITELWFNDQQATLNTSYITDNTLLVSIPKTYSENKTDKMYMHTKSDQTVEYPFKVLAPVPTVSSMSNEWAREGETVTIYGDFLIDEPSFPIEISFSGADVPHSSMTFDGSSAVTFPIPAGALNGYVKVTTASGTGQSKFVYLDDRNILFDWDGSHGGFPTGHGWRNGVVHAPGTDAWEAVDGSYLYFGGAEISGDIGGTWAEDNFSFNYWPSTGSSDYPELSSLPLFAEYISKYDVGGLSLKFEVLIPSESPWKSAAMQLVFTSSDDVTYDNATNAFFSDASLPRGLWMPWAAGEGSYDTADKWQTVTIPLADFTQSFDSSASSGTFSKKYLTGLSFFVWHGGVAGETCNPVFAIDNIRVVPNE